MQYRTFALIFAIPLMLLQVSDCFAQQICNLGVIGNPISPEVYMFEATGIEELAAPVAYSWTIQGDSLVLVSASANPTFIFEIPGEYDVCLTVTDDNGLSCSTCVIATLPNDALNQVWPGDLNNNGIANHFDLLYLGFAFNTNGFPRSIQGNSWIGTPFVDQFNGSFPDGTNFVYADANGEGTIDSFDLIAIDQNFGLMHGDTMSDILSPNNPIGSPMISLQFPNEPVVEGTEVNIPIVLGGQGTGLQNFYGIAFSIGYDSDFVDSSSVTFEWSEDSWIGNFGQEPILVIQKNNPEEAQIDIALTRINHFPVSGMGEIGSLNIIMEDNISGLHGGMPAEMKLTVESILLVDQNLFPQSALGVDLILDVITSVNHPLPAEAIRIFPNPFGQELFLESPDFPIQEAVLFDPIGRMVMRRKWDGVPTAQFSLPALPVGLYTLQVKTNEGFLVKKLLHLPRNY